MPKNRIAWNSIGGFKSQMQLLVKQ